MEPRRYKMSEAVAVAEQAAREIEEWLQTLPQTVAVQNVEKDPHYRAIDVDLIWTTPKAVYQLEIKGDRWAGTGNFFFETLSNEERGTPGCFLYTEANYVFYYFTETRVLYVLPMPPVRVWFQQNMAQFRERRTTTPVGSSHYTTVGRLVPIHRVMRAVSGVRRMQL